MVDSDGQRVLVELNSLDDEVAAALLVLDSCEHLVQANAELADRLLRACPELRTMATSRQPLGIEGVVVRRVAPLSLPRPDGESIVRELESSEAGQLFVERAAAATTPVALDERNAAAVADICRRLDGIPLALELPRRESADCRSAAHVMTCLAE